MADINITTDFSQLSSLNKALDDTANTVNSKVNPALKRLQENLAFQQRVNSTLEQSNKILTRSFTEMEITQAAKRVQNLGTVINTTRSSMNGFGVITQQAGYQIGDFIVQVQSGTNGFVAFGQQATQMVGFLPLLAQELNIAKVSFLGLSVSMAGITLGLSIIIPLLTAFGAGWMRTRQETSKTADGVQDLDSKLKALNQTVQDWLTTKAASAAGMTVDEFLGTQGIEQATSRIEAARAKLEELKAALDFSPITSFNTLIFGESAALEDARQAIIAAQEDYSKAVQDFGALSSKIAEERIASFREEMALSKERFDIEVATLRFGEESAQVRSLIAAQERRIYEESVRSRIENEEMVRLLMDQYDEQVRLKNEAKLWNDQVSLVKASLEGLNGLKVAVTLQINTAMTALENLPDWASGIYDKMRDMAWQGGLAGNATASRPPPKPPSGLAGVDWGAPSGSTSGGGGGGGNPALDSLINQLQTQREVINNWYAESQETLQSASATELEILGGKYEAMTRLEQEYQERLKGIRDEYNVTALGDAEIFFGGMADIARAGGDRTVKAMRIFSAAQALINSYVAFTEVLKDPSFIGRPWARFGAAASALSSGLAAVASIKSGSASGSLGSGGGRGSAAVPAAAQAATPQTVFIDSIDPDNLYSGQSLINLFDAFYDENDKRGKVFVVAR